MVTAAGGSLPHPDLKLDRERNARWYRSLIVLVLLAGGLYGAAKGFWVLWGPPLPAVNDVASGALGAEGRSGSLRLESGSGAGRSAPGQVGSQSQDYPPVRGPRLMLVGIILPGYALISIEGRPQRAFAVGQEIVAGLILRAIYRDRVLVERAGAQEVLVMRDATGGASPLLTAGAQPGGRMVPVAPPSAYPEVRQIGKNQYLVARDQVNAQMRDPEFLTDARLDPHPGGGFVVNGIRPDSVYEKLGLQAGDVIRTVNGAPVNSVADAVGFYQQLYQTNQVRLGVVRGGKVVQLSYNLQ